MSKRLIFDLDEDHPLQDERWNREPPVMDHVALRSGYVEEFIRTALDFGIDGQRIAILFGAESAFDPRLEWGYRIDRATEQRELMVLLNKLMEAIDSEIDSVESLKKIAFEKMSEQQEILTEDEYDLLEIYLRAWKIRDQLDFALEHDLELYIG